MATVGSLVVNLTANSAPLTKGLHAARQTLTGLGAAASAAGALLVTGAAAGMVALTKSAMEQIDVLTKASARLGIATESLAGLRHAANLSGIAAETLDTSLAKMLNNLAEAAARGGPAADALKTLGLSAEALVEMSPEKAFGAIADKIGAIQNPAKRTAAAMDLFGKSGAGLLSLFAGGSGGLSAAAEDARQLGLSFSAFDGSKVEAANDAVARLKSLFVGFGNTIAIAVAPHVKQIADSIVRLGVQVRETMVPAIRLAIEWGRVLVPFVATLLSVKGALWAAALAQRAFAAAAIFAQAVTGGPAAWAKIAVGIAAATAATIAINQQLDKTSAASQTATAAVSGLSGALDNLGGSGLSNATAQIDQIAERFRQLNEIITPGSRLDKSMRAEIDGTIDSLLQINDVVPAARQKILDLQAAFANVDKIAGDIGAEKAAELRDALKDAIGDASGFQQQFEQARMELAKVDGSISDITFALKKASDGGALPEQVKQLEEVLLKTDAIRKAHELHADAQRKTNELMQRGKTIAEQYETPVESAARKAAELRELLAAGAIDQTTFDRAIAGTPAPGDSKPQEGTAALQRGTSQSFSAIQASFRQLSGPKEKLEDLAKLQLAEAKKQTTALTRQPEHTIVVKDIA